jgi:hypothetical protein
MNIPTADTYDIMGQTVTLPVEIRKATAFTAAFAVPYDKAAQLISPTGLRPLTLPHLPGLGKRTICMLVLVDYVDGDLGPYNEFGVCFMVRDHRAAAESSALLDAKAMVTGDACALIHQLPVDGEFTRQAGRGIWGFPKIMADFDADHASDTKRASVRADGQLIAQLTVRKGIAVPDQKSSAELTSYSYLDGVTRFTPWHMRARDTKVRVGGADLILGTHPIADELKTLGLPRRALMTTSVGDFGMSFGRATEVPR